MLLHKPDLAVNRALTRLKRMQTGLCTDRPSPLPKGGVSRNKVGVAEAVPNIIIDKIS